jgi:hypothetical protein
MIRGWKNCSEAKNNNKFAIDRPVNLISYDNGKMEQQYIGFNAQALS